MRLYLAGPMAGYADDNYPAFDAARDRLRAQGHAVVSPADVGRSLWASYAGGRHEFEDRHAPARRAQLYMLHDLRVLLSCDAVVLLEGWRRATGAVFEAMTAATAGLLLFEDGTDPELLAVSRTTLARLYLEGRVRKDGSEPAWPVRSPESVCAEADRLVSADRQASYGHPADNFDRVARLWRAYLSGRWSRPGALVNLGPLEAGDVALMMVLLKIARLEHGYHRDSAVDIAGYAKCLDLIHERRSA